jgi:hypothetical protein
MVPRQDDVRLGLEEEKVGRGGGYRHLGGFIEQQQVEPGCGGLTRLRHRCGQTPQLHPGPPNEETCLGGSAGSRKGPRVIRGLHNICNSRIERG